MDNTSHTVLVQISGPEAAVQHAAEALLESNAVDYLTMGEASMGNFLALTLFIKAPAT